MFEVPFRIAAKGSASMAERHYTVDGRTSGGARDSESRTVVSDRAQESMGMTAAWQASPTFGATASVVSSMKTSRLRISSPSGFSLFEICTPPSELKSRYARRRSVDARSTNAHNRTARGTRWRRPRPVSSMAVNCGACCLPTSRLSRFPGLEMSSLREIIPGNDTRGQATAKIRQPA